MFGRLFGAGRGGEARNNNAETFNFDSQDLQDAIEGIKESQGQNTTEMEAAASGWEELAAMGRNGMSGETGVQNENAEAWSEGAMSEDELGQSLKETLAGATINETGLGATGSSVEATQEAVRTEPEAAKMVPEVSYEERLAQAAAEARPGAWMSEEERAEWQEAPREAARKQEYGDRLAQAAAEAKSGAWMGDEEKEQLKREQEAALQAPAGKKGIFGWMREMQKGMLELWGSLVKKNEPEGAQEEVAMPEMHNTENLVEDFFGRNFQGMNEQAKAVREEMAEKATLSRVAGAREAAINRAQAEGRELPADFEQRIADEEAFNTRHILETYYLGGRLAGEVNQPELSEEEQIAWKLASEPHKHGQLNLTHLFNEYPRREAETPDDYEARLKGYAKQDLRREAQLKADTLTMQAGETPEEFEIRWKKAAEMKRGENETAEEFEARWQREVVWTKEMRKCVEFEEEAERRLATMTDPEMRKKYEAILARLDARLDALTAAERAEEGANEESMVEKNAELLGKVDGMLAQEEQLAA